MSEGPREENSHPSAVPARVPRAVLPRGVLAELFAHYSYKQEQAWLAEVAAATLELGTKHGVPTEALQSNDAFASFVLQATDVALKNHRKEKIDALRNAIVSVGKPEQVDEDLAFQFLRYVEVLSVTHVAMLATIGTRHDEFCLVCKTLGDLYQQLRLCGFSELDRGVARAFLKDLQAMNLLNLVDLGDFEEFESKTSFLWTGEQPDAPLPILTDLGKRFLRFIGRETQVEGAP